MSTGRLTGKVKWFSDERAYGFITPDDMSGEVFVHRADLGHSLTMLIADQLVSYDLVDSDPRKGNGKKAANVEVLS